MADNKADNKADTKSDVKTENKATVKTVRIIPDRPASPTPPSAASPQNRTPPDATPNVASPLKATPVPPSTSKLSSPPQHNIKAVSFSSPVTLKVPGTPTAQGDAIERPSTPVSPSANKPAAAFDKSSYDFAKHLLHQFPLVNKQVKSGLYCLKRTANYLQKVANAHESCACTIFQASQHEKTKPVENEDAMKSHTDAFMQAQDLVASWAAKQRKLGTEVVEGVVKPLLDAFNAAETKRVQLCKEEERQSHLLSNAHEGWDRVTYACAQCLLSSLAHLVSW